MENNNSKIPIDIISGFLGSGKTTLLNELLKTHYKGSKIAVVENEFGQIDVDSALLPKDIEITKITGGCVCCTLKVSLIDGIRQLIDTYSLDRIVVETTGVAKLSDVISAVKNKSLEDIAFSANSIAVINPKFHNNYSSTLGSFYKDQITHADTIYISRKDLNDNDTIKAARDNLRTLNDDCKIITDVKDVVLKNSAPQSFCDDKQAHHHNHHHHENQDSEFLSSYMDVENLKGIHDLETLIDMIVEEHKPKTVFRIKGSVIVAGRQTLVQWVSGELSIKDIDLSQNRLVIITNA